MKTIMVTGGSGFIGSNLINLLFKKYKKIKVINIDKLTYASNSYFIKNKDSNNYFFHKVDICNQKKVSLLFKRYQPNIVFHLAAESHVDNSILSPKNFLKTNIIGTYNLLNVSNEYFKQIKNKKLTNFKFIHVSTDEVFGDLNFKQMPFKETDQYKPNSPYSASKASSDHLARAWFKTYNLPVIITHCSNNYGPNQNSEKLIPKIIINSLKQRDIPIYSTGKQVRDWIFVDDHNEALIKLMNFGKVGENYNIGSSNELTNINLVNYICNRLQKFVPIKNNKIQKYSDLIKHVADRAGHDQRYAISSRKLKNKLNWKPKISFNKGIDITIKWYLKNLNEKKNKKV